MPSREKPFVLFGLFIQPFNEIIVRTPVNLFQLDQNADADIELSELIFGIGRSADIAAAPLQFGAKLFLRKMMFRAQTAEVVPHVPVTA